MGEVIVFYITGTQGLKPVFSDLRIQLEVSLYNVFSRACIKWLSGRAQQQVTLVMTETGFSDDTNNSNSIAQPIFSFFYISSDII